MSKKHLRIATRKSPLALWQANHIRDKLLAHWSTLRIDLIPMVTSGDQFFKDQLSLIGGKGLFVKELEEALLDGRADFAVHSMKDVPAMFPIGLGLEAICERHNPLDALVSIKYANLSELPEGAIIGTSSLRRQSQLLSARPDLQIQPLRGNVQTRLSKLENGDYDAIVLAAAGLERMGMQSHIKEVLNTNVILPACGQGALGIECRIDDIEIKKYLAPLNDGSTEVCVRTEREVSALLGGNCHVPLAVYCRWLNDTELLLEAKVASVDGTIIIHHSQQGPADGAITLAQRCADHLLANGARDLL